MRDSKEHTSTTVSFSISRSVEEMMAKNIRSKKDNRDIKSEALKIANSQKIEGQTKEQTKLIARGIQKGIEQYLRKKSEESRALDKRSKKLKKLEASVDQVEVVETEKVVYKRAWLPWSLLLISWLLMGGYWLFIEGKL